MRAISVQDVSKRFRRYHERAQSLKERVVNLRKTEYEEFYALRNVSLEIATSETAGLIGPNGSGKSTLLKMVAGIIRPTTGRIDSYGRMATLLELGAGFHPDLTGRENIYMNASILGLTKRETDAHFDAMVAFSELEPFIDTQVRHYSSGMYVRLGFAVAVHVDPEILIIDEVLAVGDERFQNKCLDKIRSFQKDGRTIVFVTHAADLVRTICNKAFLLYEGELMADGRPADVVATYRRRLMGDTSIQTTGVVEEGSGELRVTSARLLDADGGERLVFEPGEQVTLECIVEGRCPQPDVGVELKVYREDGEQLFGTDSADRGMPVTPLDGARTARFTFGVPFLKGRFDISLGVSTAQHTYHLREKGWAFRVVNTGTDQGSIHLAPRIEIT